MQKLIVTKNSFTDTLYNKRFLIVISYLTAIILAGFWPYFSTFAKLSIPETHWIIHIHAAACTGWIILLFTQAGFIYSGNRKSHIKLGNFGVKYGYFVFVSGVIAGFAGPLMRVSSGQITLDQGAGALLTTLGAIIVFGIVFQAAVNYRHKPEIHKRLMILASVALSFAASDRLFFVRDYPFIFTALWLSPVILAIALDRLRDYKNERVYLIGIGILLLGESRMFFNQSELWLPTGRWLVNIFL